MKSRATGDPPVQWIEDNTGNMPAPRFFIDLRIVPPVLSVVPRT